MECFSVRVLRIVRCCSDVQRHDSFGIHFGLVGTKSEPLYVLVLHYQFLSLSDGDLSAQRHRYGAVGYIHICGADSGGVQRSGARAGSTDGAAVAQLGGRICDRSDAGKSVRQPKNLCLVAVQLS